MSRSDQVPHPPGTSPFESRELAGVVGKNLGAIVKMRAKEERKKSLQDRIADTLTRYL